MADLESAVMQREYNQAKKMANEILTAPANKDQARQAQFYLGLSHLELGEYSQSKTVFEKLIKEKLDDSTRDRAYVGLVNSYYLSEDYKNALKVMEKLLKISPRSEISSLIYLKAARVHLKLAHWNKAREYLKRIVHEYPNSLEVHTAQQLLEEKQYFAVQVGAFLDRKLAEEQVTRLRKKNEYVYIVETVGEDNQKYYRVRVGQSTLLDDARKLESKLSKEGYPTQIYP